MEHRVKRQQMQQGEILRHRQGENKFLVVFQQQMPFREISQNLKRIKIINLLIFHHLPVITFPGLFFNLSEYETASSKI